MIIYYPYFIAEKSGTLNVFNNKVVIEAVRMICGIWLHI